VPVDDRIGVDDDLLLLRLACNSLGFDLLDVWGFRPRFCPDAPEPVSTYFR